MYWNEMISLDRLKELFEKVNDWDFIKEIKKYIEYGWWDVYYINYDKENDIILTNDEVHWIWSDTLEIFKNILDEELYDENEENY